MDRQRTKDILEGIGFFAVIASLIFVAIETRNSSQQTALNTQAVEMAAYQELMNTIQEINELTLADDTVTEVWMDVYGAQENSIDSFRRDRALFILFRHGDLAYFQFERGAIDEDRLRSAIRPLPLWNPEVVEWWNNVKDFFVPSYVDYIDSLIAQYDSDTP